MTHLKVLPQEIEANATVIESMNVELDAMRSLIQQTDDIESQVSHPVHQHENELWVLMGTGRA